MAHSEDHELSGQCLCGAVEVTLSGGLGLTMECHCRDCQKAVGGGAAYIAMVDRDKTAFSGEMRGYTVTGESGGTVTRYFCPVCGTPTHSEVEKFPEKYVLKVGLFGPQSAAKPSLAIWTGSAPDWHCVVDGIPNFERTPPPRG